MPRKALGTLLVSISACAFGAYSYFASIAGDAGIGPVSLLFYRFLIATLIIGVVALIARTPFPRGIRLVGLVVLGGLYVGQSFAYLQCLRASNPIVTSLLLYLYPAFVTIGSTVFLHEKLTAVKLVALGSALVGSMLIIGPVGGVTPAAIAYGLATALFYATYLVSGKWLLRGVAPLAATLVIFLTAGSTYGIVSLVIGFDRSATPAGWIATASLAVVSTVIAIGFLLWGLEYVSPVEASALSALEPLVTALIAVTLMHQDLRALHVAGGVLVIVAVVLLARKAREPDLGEAPEAAR